MHGLRNASRSKVSWSGSYLENKYHDNTTIYFSMRHGTRRVFLLRSRDYRSLMPPKTSCQTQLSACVWLPDLGSTVRTREPRGGGGHGGDSRSDAERVGQAFLGFLISVYYRRAPTYQVHHSVRHRLWGTMVNRTKIC